VQRFEREHHRLLDAAMDQQLVLVRVDVREAAAGDDEVQAVGCDAPVEHVVRR
jgi:hypothetical protein